MPPLPPPPPTHTHTNRFLASSRAGAAASAGTGAGGRSHKQHHLTYAAVPEASYSGASFAVHDSGTLGGATKAPGLNRTATGSTCGTASGGGGGGGGGGMATEGVGSSWEMRDGGAEAAGGRRCPATVTAAFTAATAGDSVGGIGGGGGASGGMAAGGRSTGQRGTGGGGGEGEGGGAGTGAGQGHSDGLPPALGVLGSQELPGSQPSVGRVDRSAPACGSATKQRPGAGAPERQWGQDAASPTKSLTFPAVPAFGHSADR